MPTKEMLAACIANLRACVSMGFATPNWQVDELLTAYGDAKNEADIWRRAYNRTGDAYRDLLASKPEVYLVDGHDAAYWRRWFKRSVDSVKASSNRYAALSTRHEALSTEYLALRTKNDSLNTELGVLRKMYTELNTAYWRSQSEELKELKTKYNRLQRVATECEDELREIRQINS